MSSGASRREFLKSLGRGFLLAGIGALAVKLVGRNGPRLLGGTSSRLGETCINSGICPGCSVFSGCGLPQALSARQRAPWARLQGGKL